MKLLLRSDVDGVGKRGDIVDVAAGFARNSLIPKGYAIKASPGVEKQAEQMRRSRLIKDATERAGAEEIAKKLVPAIIHIAARAGDEGKLFGSVTTTEIADAVRGQTNIDLDRKDLIMEEPIKTTGTHSVTAKLHADVQFQITVEVTASGT
jgi:large subunit ribosomal protein L9